MAETAPKTLESSGSSKSVPDKSRSSSGRWLVRGGLLLALLATAVWFTPTIVAKTSLRQHIPKLIFPTYPGTVEVGETTIGWFSPIVVRGLRAEDAEGHTLLDRDLSGTDLEEPDDSRVFGAVSAMIEPPC